MATLAEQIRAARETWISASGFDFQVRRPTTLQLLAWKELANAEFLAKVVVGWKLRGDQLTPGGGGKIPPFDPEAFVEWVGDRPAIVDEILEKVIALYTEHAKAKDDQQKK